MGTKPKRKQRLKQSPIQAFLKINQDLPRIVDGLIVGFRHDNDGYIHMVVGVPEDLTADAIKHAAQTIRTWRERLNDWLGPKTRIDKWVLFSQFERDHANGKSYSDIARELNEYVAICLRDYFSSSDDRQSGEWFAGRAACDRLRLMGFSNEDIENWFSGARDNFTKGNAAWGDCPDSGPISRDQVIARIRAFREWKQRNKRG